MNFIRLLVKTHIVPICNNYQILELGVAFSCIIFGWNCCVFSLNPLWMFAAIFIFFSMVITGRSYMIKLIKFAWWCSCKGSLYFYSFCAEFVLFLALMLGCFMGEISAPRTLILVFKPSVTSFLGQRFRTINHFYIWISFTVKPTDFLLLQSSSVTGTGIWEPRMVCSGKTKSPTVLTIFQMFCLCFLCILPLWKQCHFCWNFRQFTFHTSPTLALWNQLSKWPGLFTSSFQSRRVMTWKSIRKSAWKTLICSVYHLYLYLYTHIIYVTCASMYVITGNVGCSN